MCTLGLKTQTIIPFINDRKQTIYFMKQGDLVRIFKHNAIGIVTEVFADLNPKEPWIRVLFTHPTQTYQWCKLSGLELITKEGGLNAPLPGVDASGSL